VPLSASTIQSHHTIIRSALEAAVRDRLVTRNVATLVKNKPKKAIRQDVLDHVWTAEEAGAFLATAKEAGPLRWDDVDLDAGTITIRRSLRGIKDLEPVYGPLKNRLLRTVETAPETVELLRTHKAHQAEAKLRNRTTYRDHGLVFAKEWDDVRGRESSLGSPIQVNSLGQREFARIVEAAGVKRIKFHGLRHTVATLMLQAGEPVHIVQRRLGHSKPEITLGIYAHCLPGQQSGAASRLAELLHG
jgi:integrase